jgi:hypothetical protein
MSHSFSPLVLVVVSRPPRSFGPSWGQGLAGVPVLPRKSHRLSAHQNIKEGIKRDALLTAQASGALGKCQCQAEETGTALLT